MRPYKENYLVYGWSTVGCRFALTKFDFPFLKEEKIKKINEKPTNGFSFPENIYSPCTDSR